jgi:hypothetical protein
VRVEQQDERSGEVYISAARASAKGARNARRRNTNACVNVAALSSASSATSVYIRASCA